ncbi:deoxyribonuclease IV [Anaerotardibacter muris]|uniref:deoxyribonuclease IV n=1 Tax=Anaerotardibacter muris TaxID=2941505 RepID=UPI00203BAE4B|nr:deoxyribonuclease IV [Anaerotardibacter muris]
MQDELIMGCHLSSSKGYEAMARTAESIKANTFAFFTRNPRGGAAKAIDPEDIARFEIACEQIGMGPIVAHGSYTINPCSAIESVREFALQALTDDLARMEFTPGQLFNMHPGSHTGQGVEAGIEQIAETLNQVITPEQTTTVLLETMSGKGSEVGGTFEQLAAIRERIDHPEKVGVCLDTCHVWDAGYDIVNDLDGVLDEFDRVIGLEHLRALHINDSLNDCGAHKDRHARIGEGKIGADALVAVVDHPRLRGLPCILETPNELPGYAKEIAFFRKNYR